MIYFLILLIAACSKGGDKSYQSGIPSNRLNSIVNASERDFNTDVDIDVVFVNSPSESVAGRLAECIQNDGFRRLAIFPSKEYSSMLTLIVYPVLGLCCLCLDLYNRALDVLISLLVFRFLLDLPFSVSQLKERL